MSKLFSTLKLKEIEFKNRIFVSPMCQYCSKESMPTEWHFVHLGSRAVGGAALVLAEAAAVSPEGRITPWDNGMWCDEHAQAFKPIAAFIKAQGAIPGIQINHTGRKASTDAPWRNRRPLGESEGGWKPLAPSAIPVDRSSPVPREMTHAEIAEMVFKFSAAARRCHQAGFEVLELHMAHGYLCHQFLSPLSNQRRDEYGGNLENRARFPLEVAQAVRKIWPGHLPLFVRISCTDWMPGGWDLPQSIELCRSFKKMGVDLIDCSSGGMLPDANIPVGPGYQVPLAAAIRREVGIATGAVGLITQPFQAEEIVATGQADAVLLGREFLRNPYWPLYAARALGGDVSWPLQYERAKI
jgi:2,4-dienoyl-CoA reductase-like NADH-dependent reductase (Old Yellow Enzyme family)